MVGRKGTAKIIFDASDGWLSMEQSTVIAEKTCDEIEDAVEKRGGKPISDIHFKEILNRHVQEELTNNELKRFTPQILRAIRGIAEKRISSESTQSTQPTKGEKLDSIPLPLIVKYRKSINAPQEEGTVK